MKASLLALALFCFISLNAQNVTKLYRYVNTVTAGHFYTTNWNELGNGKFEFKFENVAGYVYSSATDGTVPMHRYYNKTTKSHFYTTNWEELGNGKAPFTYEGIAFYAFKDQAEGTVPFYRYYNQRYNNHFFTANFAELGKGKDGFKSEGIACYIFADESSAVKKKEEVVTPAVAVETKTEAPKPVEATKPVEASNPNANYFILFDNNTRYTNFSPVFKTALFNQVVAVWNNNQPLMLIMLPANGSHTPEPGTYNIAEGSKRTVKKGSQVAKLEFEPGYVSAEGGTLTITEHDSIFKFIAENVTIVNSKTNESKKLTFTISMFIEKK
jgi:hypothetical protein